MLGRSLDIVLSNLGKEEGVGLEVIEEDSLKFLDFWNLRRSCAEINGGLMRLIQCWSEP